MQYSIVIPLYNEAGSLETLWSEITAAMKKITPSWEAIFINDGSTDGSGKILSALASKNKQIKIIEFRRNRGKAGGLQAGFNAATGDIVITMDADLQDDPKEIAALTKKLNDGYDLVSGYKHVRHDPWHKTVPSYFFNGLIRWMSGVKLHDVNCGLKAYRKEVVKSLRIYGELYRFIPILAASNGFKVGEIPVKHRTRKFGKSKYGITRFVRGLLDLLTVTFLTKFLKRPLHLFGTLGLLFFVSGFIVLLYLTIIKFARHASISDRPLLLFGILFIIAGIQLISTGLIAELITHYTQTRAIDGDGTK